MVALLILAPNSAIVEAKELFLLLITVRAMWQKFIMKQLMLGH